MIVHRGFTGNLSKNPNGTGPFTLADYAIGEKAILKRVDQPIGAETSAWMRFIIMIMALAPQHSWLL